VLLAHGRLFSLGTPASSTTKTGRHDIAEILLKVVLNTINQIKSIFIIPLANHLKLKHYVRQTKFNVVLYQFFSCAP
jgi:hypothetical protein